MINNRFNVAYHLLYLVLIKFYLFLKQKIMNILKWLFGTRNPALNKPVVMRMCLESEEMNEWQKTDVVINVLNCPFITLTESKTANLWYHEEMDAVFCLTSRGFKVIKGSKKMLFERGLGRHYA